MAIAGSILLLAGCGIPGGHVQDIVSQSLDESASAVSTARMAVELDSSGKLTRAAASTALGDALKELEKSRSAVAEPSVSVRKDRDLRNEALEVLDGCVAAVVAAADALSSQEGGPAAAGRLLTAAASRLLDLKNRLGGK